MAPSSWSFLPATELLAALADRRVSSVELTLEAIDRIERHDGRINAICVRDFERALADARAADDARRGGDKRALLGLPMTVKESYNVAGLPTTWGFSEHRDFIAREDALSISRVRQAGAVILGKTNVPVGLGDWQSYNDIYGTTNNPYDLGRTPGGSSGGSSAAIAAGFGPLSLGSDIGGSLRVPAFHCGIFAHKPTYGIVPQRGHNPPPWPPSTLDRDMSVLGPMARSATDLSLLLDVISGPDPLESGLAYRLDLPAARHQGFAGFRVFVLDSHPLLPPVAEIRTAIDDLARKLAGAGATITRQSPLLPDFTETSRLYMRMLTAFTGAFMPPEVVAGARTAAESLAADDRSLRAERLRGVVRSHRDWIMDEGARARVRAQWRAFFGSFDALICPIMPTPAYPHDHAPEQELRHITIEGRDYLYPDQLAWPGIATLPGLPATAVPLGLSKEGLPIGAQIVGPFLGDRTPLKLAALIEQAFGGFIPPPMFAD